MRLRQGEQSHTSLMFLNILSLLHKNPLYAGNIGSFTNFANTLGTGYDPTGGAYSAGVRGGETVPYIGGPPRSYGGEGESLFYPAGAAPPPRILLPYDPTAGPPKRELLGGIVPPDVAEARLNDPAFMRAMNQAANVPAYGGTDAYMPYDPPIYTPTPQDIAIAEANAAAEARIADPQEQVPPFNYPRLDRDIPYMPYDPSTRPPSYGSGMDLGGIVSAEDAEARLRDASFMSGMNKEAGWDDPYTEETFDGFNLPYRGTGRAAGGGKAVIPSYDPYGASGGTLGIDRGIDIDELDRQEAERAGLEARKKLAKERRENQAKQDALLTGAVRSWDAKLGDITINPDGTVNLPVDMWRNADSRDYANFPDQEIGKEQIEDAIRRLAELGGKDTLNSSVENMLQQAKAYYRDTPRGDGTWDRNIEGGLIPEDQRSTRDYDAAGTWLGSFLNDSAWKATWGDIAGGVLDKKAGERLADIESQIPPAWANNPAGFNSYNKEQQDTIVKEGLESHQEVENYYAKKAMEYDPLGGGETGMGGLGGPPPPSNGTGTGTGTGTGGDTVDGAGTANQFDFAKGAMEGFPPPIRSTPRPPSRPSKRSCLV